jgi:hypothetical protein
MTTFDSAIGSSGFGVSGASNGGFPTIVSVKPRLRDFADMAGTAGTGAPLSAVWASLTAVLNSVRILADACGLVSAGWGADPMGRHFAFGFSWG